ncbi:hypothetical protein PTKIN_Ptkin04bG0102100 [Pterospermum kingtungense]
MKIDEKIGRPICVDQATDLVSKGKFARLCVEIDITKPLLVKFKLRRRIRKIEYEGIHLVCFNCGVYGHRKDTCPAFGHERNHVDRMALVFEEMRQAGEGMVGIGPNTESKEVGLVASGSGKDIGEKDNANMDLLRQSWRTDLLN